MSVFDTKLIKGPTTWDGSKNKWRHWSSKLGSYLRGVSRPLAELMKIAADYAEPISHVGMAPVTSSASSSVTSVRLDCHQRS